MIVKEIGTGQSFKGAWQYYFHDKRAENELERLTAERVLFTHTENLPTGDPELAWQCMVHTARNQEELKRQAGVSNRGRKMEGGPVYAYVLSWDRDEDPAKEEMLKAGQDSLKQLGLESHEAIMAAHNDTAYKHLHIIANRVHPENGRAYNRTFSWRKMQAWALQYERTQGRVRCEQRERNARLREKGEKVRYRSFDRSAEFYAWRRERVRQDAERRQAQSQELSARHRAQRKALYEAKEKQIREARQKIRDEHSHYWRALFLGQERERRKLQIQHEQKTAALKDLLGNRTVPPMKPRRSSRSRRREGPAPAPVPRPAKSFFPRRGMKGRAATSKHQELPPTVPSQRTTSPLRWADEVRKGRLSPVFAMQALTDERAELEAIQEAERARLAERIGEKRKQAFAEINERYRRNLETLKEYQKHERKDQALEHSRESQEQARRIRRGDDEDVFDRERRQDTYKAFRETKEETTREKNQDRGRERSRKRKPLGGPWKPD